MSQTAIPRDTKELDSLRRDICRKAGIVKNALTPLDFSYLESDIKRTLPNAQIAQKTLKRLFGYDSTPPISTIRRYTADILARYIGYSDWTDYINYVNEKGNSGDFTGNEVNTEELDIGETDVIAWNPDRQSTLKYLGGMRFKIVKTVNSKWQEGDTFLCRRFILGKNLLVDNLCDTAGRLKAKMYVVGENGGLTKLESSHIQISVRTDSAAQV